MAVAMVYMTAADEAEALRIGSRLVEARLAACVNVLGTIRSVYRWQGEVRDEPEVAFVAKTRQELVPALAAEVKRLHSYEVPCVVALSASGGLPEFLAWVEAETGGSGS
jgi:periplasmic divalent cation tolerance protein